MFFIYGQLSTPVLQFKVTIQRKTCVKVLLGREIDKGPPTLIVCELGVSSSFWFRHAVTNSSKTRTPWLPMLSQFLFKRIKVKIDAISHNRRDFPIKQLADLNTSLLTSGARSIDLCWFGSSIVHSINQLIIDSFTRRRKMTHTRFHYIARLCLPEDGTFRRPGTVPIPSSLCVLLRAGIYRSRWWVYLRCLFRREHPIPLHLPQQGVTTNR